MKSKSAFPRHLILYGYVYDDVNYEHLREYNTVSTWLDTTGSTSLSHFATLLFLETNPRYFIRRWKLAVKNSTIIDIILSLHSY